MPVIWKHIKHKKHGGRARVPERAWDIGGYRHRGWAPDDETPAVDLTKRDNEIEQNPADEAGEQSEES